LSGVRWAETSTFWIGTKVSCRGTARSATRVRKIQSRPRNFIQLKAYAAKAARVTGMIVAGIEIMKLLKKLWPRLLDENIWE
jgi:hypothetical protein